MANCTSDVYQNKQSGPSTLLIYIILLRFELIGEYLNVITYESLFCTRAKFDENNYALYRPLLALRYFICCRMHKLFENSIAFFCMEIDRIKLLF